MIKIFLKYLIYEICISVLVDSIKRNFSKVKSDPFRMFKAAGKSLIAARPIIKDIIKNCEDSGDYRDLDMAILMVNEMREEIDKVKMETMADIEKMEKEMDNEVLGRNI